VHHPEHDGGFWSAIIEWIQVNRPDEIILAGDFCEFSSMSQHSKVVESMLDEDFVAGRQGLVSLREAAPDARITYLAGNHETRVDRWLAENAPQLKRIVTVPKGLDLESLNVEWVPEEKQPVRRGRLAVLHGHQFLGKYGPKFHSMKAADIYAAEAGSVVVYGHTHTPQMFTRAVVGGQITGIGLGCGRTIGPDEVRWLHGRQAGWTHQFAVAYVMPSGTATVYPVTVQRGQFIWGGRLYGR
jgi:predicted phosphodiesterase